MRRMILPSLAALAAALAVGAAASAEGGGDEPWSFRLVGTTTSESFVDAEPKQTSESAPPTPGDMFLGSDALTWRNSGKPAGTFVFACTFITSSWVQCHGTFDLPKGQLTGQIAFESTAEGPDELHVAITGGSGAYSGARGSIHQTTTPDGKDVFTVRLR